MAKSAAQWTVAKKEAKKAGGSRFTLRHEMTGEILVVTSSPKSAEAIRTISNRYRTMFKNLAER